MADKVASVVESKEYDFVMCNFAPPDMVRFFLFLVIFPRGQLCIPLFPARVSTF